MGNDVYDYYYENYLMLYGMYGSGRPRLTRERYEELDRELLDSVGDIPMGNAEEVKEREFKREAFNRIREIEFLLLDDLSEALMRREDTPEEDDPEEEAAPVLEFTWSEDAGSHAP